MATVARFIAVVAAMAAAIFYVLIGFQVLAIGRSAQGGTPDLLGFGLAAGGFYAGLAILLALAQGRLVWIPVAAVDLVIVIAYFAMANLRDPQFEVWGLTVKAFQLVMFGALVYLAYHGRRARGDQQSWTPFYRRTLNP
jgi:hypothetical protein